MAGQRVSAKKAKHTTHMKINHRQFLGVIAVCFLNTACALLCRAGGSYHFLKEIPVGGEGSWDYLSVDDANRRLYVSHATKVVVIDLDKEVVVGEIADTPGVHGLAPAPDLQRGVTSNGRENKASIVDLKTLVTLSKVDTGQNPDGMLYEPSQQEAYLFNGRGQSATVIDVKSGKSVATIPLPGKPEFAAADPKAGRVYNNIDRKSTRLNSSHSQISYAVFCLKKKTNYPLMRDERRISDKQAPIVCILTKPLHGSRPRPLLHLPPRQATDLSPSHS